LAKTDSEPLNDSWSIESRIPGFGSKILPDIAVNGLGIGFVEAASRPLAIGAEFQTSKVQQWTTQRTWHFPWDKSLAPAKGSCPRDPRPSVWPEKGINRRKEISP
jgi:hypothetical protein